MSTLSVHEELLTDLSGYYIIKKYRHGWLLGSVKFNNEQCFLSSKQLIEMGYLDPSEYESENENEQLANTPLAIPIIVPTSPSTFKKRSKSYDKEFLTPQSNQTNLNIDWRKSKEDNIKN